MAHQSPAPHGAQDAHAVAPNHHHDAHGHHDHHDVSEDRGPAYIGLVATALLLLGLMYGMVQWTNGRFEGHSKAAGAAAAAHK